MNQVLEIDPLVDKLTEAAEDVIFCVICQDPIPEARARRQTSTCSEKCKNKLDAIRDRQRAARKCPLCLHPSTPEERAEFRLWRAQRGDVRTSDRRAPGDKRDMERTLRRAIKALSGEKDRLKAQLDAQIAPDGFSGPGMAIPDEGLPAHLREIAARVEMFTTLTRDAESVLTPKAQPE